MSDNKQKINTLRDFPAVEILTAETALTSYVEKFSRLVVTQIVRETVSELKEKFQSDNKSLSRDTLIKNIIKRLDDLATQFLTRVINGAGIIVHTNLGRAPLSKAMLENAFDAITGYSNLEYDLKTGRRGKRGLLVERLLADLCGTESGTVVNNNAAALFIILNTLANRKEVIISRGELVQIGGGFKIPDIMTRAGARLVEVGTTNRTNLDDYASAITERTRMVLKVHRSNFAQVGFVTETGLDDLAQLCRRHDLILVNDLGSGLFEFPEGVAVVGEPTVYESVHAGANLTCFSGDKLLGGAQAGLIAGNRELVTRLKKNPLFRTLRCDKLVFHLTIQVLLSYLNGTAYEDLPVWKMVTCGESELKQRGEKIIEQCPGKNIVLAACGAYLGGGSTPAQKVPSLALSLRGQVKPNALADRFRKFQPPIIGRVNDDDFLIDLRTVAPEDDKILIAAINSLV